MNPQQISDHLADADASDDHPKLRMYRCRRCGYTMIHDIRESFDDCPDCGGHDWKLRPLKL